jgi:hypothetical protein
MAPGSNLSVALALAPAPHPLRAARLAPILRVTFALLGRSSWERHKRLLISQIRR